MLYTVTDPNIAFSCTPSMCYLLSFAFIPVKESLKIPKGQSESEYRRRTDNTMANRKSTKGQRSAKHWNRTMLNLCDIVVAILKTVTGRNFSMSGINSRHHYLPTYKTLMISDNFEFFPPIFYAVFWQPFWKWQTSRKFLKRRIAPLMVTYHYVKFYVSIIIYLWLH